MIGIMLMGQNLFCDKEFGHQNDAMKRMILLELMILYVILKSWFGRQLDGTCHALI